MESAYESASIMRVPNNIVSANKNSPVMGLKQDALLAMYRLTHKDVFLTLTEMNELVSSFAVKKEVPERMVVQGSIRLPQPAVMKPTPIGLIPLWTGKQAISLIFPRDLAHTGFTNGHPDSEQDPIPLWAKVPLPPHVCPSPSTLTTYKPCGKCEECKQRAILLVERMRVLTKSEMSPTDTKVLIARGEMLTGMLCKKTMGASGNSLIHTIFIDGGPDAAAALINNSTRVAHSFLLTRTTSIGYDDMLPAGRYYQR